MYKKININEMQMGILSLFTAYGREYYIREIERILAISPRSVQLALEVLEKKAVLESKLKGKIKLYSLRRTVSAALYAVMAEQYKTIFFIESHPLVAEILAKAKPHINGIGLVFGSYAKGLEKKDSDIDLFVAGDCNASEIRRIGKIYGIDVNIKQYPLEIFEKSIKTDVLLKEILSAHIIFLNSEMFVKAVLGNG